LLLGWIGLATGLAASTPLSRLLKGLKGAFYNAFIRHNDAHATVGKLSLEDSMRPKTDGILECSLYVSDVPRSVRFYEETFGFRVISEFGERGCAVHAGTRQVLLIFKKTASRATQPPHDGDGELHLAFAIPADELANWESWLQTRGIPVEERRKWELGGSSLFFRDPDHHLIELATPGVWAVY
jgi:catechol 2,3-dioxygenase-like lactoylglutathione lyase family enzyme